MKEMNGVVQEVVGKMSYYLRLQYGGGTISGRNRSS